MFAATSRLSDKQEMQTTDTRGMASQSDSSVGLTTQLPDFKQSHQAEALPKISVSTTTLKLLKTG